MKNIDNMKYRYLSSILFFLPVFLGSCQKDDLPEIKTPIAETTDLYGVVTDSEGNYMPGVVVSDGYSCAVTDGNGVWQLTANEFSYQVYVSIPADCRVTVKDGYPDFWKKIENGVSRYDFTLEKMSAPEDEFDLVCVADPQCQTASNVSRFTSETAVDLRAYAAGAEVPKYGVLLGDIGWNTANTDYTNAVFPLMKVALKEENVGMPMFFVIGNHDNKVIEVSTDDYTVAHDIAAQRNFEYAFGPVNYSFNRGEAHIVVMDNIIFPNHDDYYLGFRDDQVEWLRQDLESVSKDKMLILCVHIPIRANEGNNVDKVVELIEQFAEVHVMSGHTHYAENNEYDGHYEHVHGAACGAWWRTVINADGTPNGYSVYRVDGASFSNWYYKSVGFDKDYQIRLYRGNLKYMDGYASQYEFYYKGEGDIIANIWNADSGWTVTVFEDDTETGKMEPYGSGATRRDAWASGYLLGVLGLSGTSYDKSNVSHLYHYTLKNPDASSVRVVATDSFGNTYEQTEFTPNTTAGFPEAIMPGSDTGE